jgi:hypothetical protein
MFYLNSRHAVASGRRLFFCAVSAAQYWKVCRKGQDRRGGTRDEDHARYERDPVPTKQLRGTKRRMVGLTILSWLKVEKVPRSGWIYYCNCSQCALKKRVW